VESNSEERIKRKAKRLGESEEKQGMEAVWKFSDSNVPKEQMEKFKGLYEGKRHGTQC
jgi:hypothetical protein